MRKIRYFVTIFGSLLAMSIGGTGCVNIAPWERGILAKPQMEWDPHTLCKVNYNRIATAVAKRRQAINPLRVAVAVAVIKRIPVKIFSGE